MKEWITSAREVNIGKIPWNKGLTSKEDSRIRSGENHPNWVKDKKTKRRMGVSEYNKKVLDRDGHLCQVCLVNNILTKNNLRVHHFVPYHVYPHHTIEKMITVCKECHDYIHKNGLVINNA